MLKTLTSLRRQKEQAADKMELLNLRAQRDGRDLTAIETLQYDLAKQQAENLADCIHELEGEIDFTARVPQPAPGVDPVSLAFSQAAEVAPVRERCLWMH